MLISCFKYEASFSSMLLRQIKNTKYKCYVFFKSCPVSAVAQECSKDIPSIANLAAADNAGLLDTPQIFQGCFKENTL
jgi:hypothetical protein